MRQRTYNPLDDLVGQCVVCHKFHFRFDVELWRYHVSVGVVCRHHHGVEEWYKELLRKAGEEIAGGYKKGHVSGTNT